MTRISRSLSLFAVLVLISSAAQAQDAPVTDTMIVDPSATTTEVVTGTDTPVTPTDAESATAYEMEMLSQVEKNLREKLMNDTFSPPAMNSLLFPPWQYTLLREARIGFNTRKPTEGELASGDSEMTNSLMAGVREISLGGILFISEKDWTIWLNKQRVTPDALPPEATDIRVHKEYVELKWFDNQTNAVYPVRLRPNQRFNLDARMFLPGSM